MVRTIEFADGRRVTITHPIGKGGMAAATEALDRASERARVRQEPDKRQYVAETDDERDVDARRRAPKPDGRSRERAWYEPDPEPAMAQADDDDITASTRTTRRRSR